MTKEKLFLYSPIVQSMLVKFLDELEVFSEGTPPMELVLAGISSMFATSSIGDHKDQMKQAATILNHTPSLFGMIMGEYVKGENHDERVKTLAEATGENEKFLNQLPLSHLTDEEFSKYVSMYQMSINLYTK